MTINYRIPLICVPIAKPNEINYLDVTFNQYIEQVGMALGTMWRQQALTINFDNYLKKFSCNAKRDIMAPLLLSLRQPPLDIGHLIPQPNLFQVKQFY